MKHESAKVAGSASERKGDSTMDNSTVCICGKRTARFLCTLDKGHKGPHGRRYRRTNKEAK
jgi:hypothetical protein